MDSIEDMLLKLLVRGMNPSGHFGALKSLLFFRVELYLVKKKPQKTQHCTNRSISSLTAMAGMG